MSFWSDVGDVVGKAFDWINKNETAADFITGAAVGMLQYQAAAEQREADLQLAELRERREDDRQRVNYAGVDNYTGNLTANGGLLTNGLLSQTG